MSVEVYEPVQLVVDNLVLQGLEANLVATNAVSKAYVDSHISSAVSALVDSAPATLDTLKEIATALGNVLISHLPSLTLLVPKPLHESLRMLVY
jgi:hypothetical protein